MNVTHEACICAICPWRQGQRHGNRAAAVDHAQAAPKSHPSDAPLLPLLGGARRGLARRLPLVRCALQRVQLLLVAGNGRVQLRSAARLRLPGLGLRLQNGAVPVKQTSGAHSRVRFQGVRQSQRGAHHTGDSHERARWATGFSGLNVAGLARHAR